MMSKTSRYLLSVMVMGIFVFLGSTSIAQAGCDVPQFCITDNEWTVTLLDNGPEVIAPCYTDDVNHPLYGSELNGTDVCYKWSYHVTNPDGETNGLNQINFTFPVNCSEDTLMVEGENTVLQRFPAGGGDPTTEFGQAIQEIFVARFTPNMATGVWSFYSSEGKMASATVALKVKKLYACEIAGPNHNGDDPSAVFTVSAQQDILTSDGKKFHIVEDVETQCIISGYEIEIDDVTGEETHRPLTSVPMGQIFKSYEEDDDGNLLWEAEMEAIGGLNQKCFRAFGKSKGDNTWYYISGRRVWR